MTKISVRPDGKNAPRKAFLKDFNVAFATGDADFIIEHVSDNIIWIMHGDKSFDGKKQFSEEIAVMKNHVADEVVIHSIITHGREAAASGEIKMGGKTYAFCDIYHFTNTKSNVIKEMHSYVIEK